MKRLSVRACAALAAAVFITIAPLSAQTKVKLFLHDGEDRGKAKNFGKVLDDYGSFITLQLPTQATERMRAAGLDVEPLDENIGFGIYRFDPARGVPAVPAKLKEHDTGVEARYYLVQFRGPIRDEWIASLQSSGAEAIQYVPQNAMIVHATPSQIARAARGPEVRWSDLLHPAYKLSKDLSWMLGAPLQRVQQDRQRYRVAIFSNENLDVATAQIASRGGHIENIDAHPNLYFRLALIDFDTARLDELASLREVARIETWYPAVPEDERSNQIIAGNFSGTTVPSAGYATFLTARGVNGTGIAVGVVDDGVDTAEMHLTGRVTDNATIRRGAAAGADGHGHHDAAIIAGQCAHNDAGGFNMGGGIAPQAHIINIPFLRSGYTGSDLRAQADIVETVAANGQPGTISSNSWGAGLTPSYGSLEALMDTLVHDASSTTAGQQPLAMIFSAGNSGPGASTITSPKAAKNILVVGATENYRPAQSGGSACGTINADNIDEVGCFSSRGPAEDGRIRPDVVAPGTWIASALAGPNPLWGNIDANHRYSTGTSQAAPHVAGATALIQQWWKASHAGQLPAPALSKALIINGAVDPTADAAGFVPNNSEGWGRVNLTKVVASGIATIYNNQENVLTTVGQTYSVGGTISSAAQPFRVTLVWSDAPGAAGANPALVNNLDLEVTVAGNTFKGNIFTNGQSTAGGASDTINNVEAVYLPAGVTGNFVVTIRASALGGDGAQGTGDSTDQHFALVIFNGNTCASPLPPSPAAVTNGNNRIDVSWSAVSGATSYRVLRSTTAGGPYTQIGTPAASPYVDTNVSAFITYYYVVRAIGGCESANSAETSATALGILPAPTGLAATLNSTTSVALTWNAVSGAVSYRVYRTPNNSAYTLVGSPNVASFVDTTASANVAYLYKVVAVDPGAGVSPDSSKVLATTVAFTDPTLTAGTTTIKSAHITQLRTAVNLVRALAGQSPAAFTDPVLSTSTNVRRLHVTELRSVLDTVRANLGLTALSYTDPAITANVTGVKAVHIKELRNGVGATVVPPAVVSQILLNPGFELGVVNWTAAPGVISNGASYAARTGTWNAWLCGYGEEHIDTVEQQVTIPAAATSATLSFWLWIETEDEPDVAFDFLRIQILNSEGAVVQTLATYSNENATAGYVEKTFNLTAYAGQTIKVRFYGTEDEIYYTSYVIDDTSLTVSQPGS
ncbi:MAG: S8 family serine peptidase [Thermoanaerobaculia bacterium]